MKSEELMNTQQIVQRILETNREARESDRALYMEVIKLRNSQMLEFPFADVLRYFKDFGVPCYESVGRCRRKLQAQFPELRGSRDNEQARYENAVEYEKFARSEVR